MTDLSSLSKTVIEEISKTPEYIDFMDKLRILKKDRPLFERVNEFREKNFMLQQSNREDLMEMMDALTNEYEDVINIELVDDFMEAEAGFCRMMQDFYHDLTNGLEFD